MTGSAAASPTGYAPWWFSTDQAYIGPGEGKAGAVPFLGPAIAAWITLSVGVMACYYLFIVPRARTEDGAARPSVSSTRWVDSRPPPVRAVPRVDPVTRAAPWSATAPSLAPRALDPKAGGSGLPRYDMEDFPTEQWGRAGG